MTPMEKYGVDEVPDDVKIAADGTAKCPVCGGTLRPIEVTGVYLCVTCGSKPFERKEREPDAGTKPE